MNLQPVPVRTTVDLPPALFRRAKIYAADRGEPLKSVISEALENYIGKDDLPSAEVLWKRMRRLSKEGKQGVNLVEFLRHDRDTRF